MRRLLGHVDQVKVLADKLTSLQVVATAVRRRGSGSVDDEAWQIATAISDIEESAHKLLNDILPRLLRANTEDEATELLHAVGEEYRHIMYHIKDTKLFDYLAAEYE